MFNVMLDELPDMWEGFPIDTDFRIGVQISQIMEDKDLSDNEKWGASAELLFRGIRPDPPYYYDAIMWFLQEWNHDNNKKSKDRTRVLDYDIDQWRLYSAFKAQYGIDLNTVNMHYWQFMGMLTTLNECAFTRVVDVRLKRLRSNMTKEEKQIIKDQKTIYGLEQPQEQISEDEKVKKREALELFEKMRKAKS